MIRAIDDLSVDQITSGQVVTSLASSLKELVENALDSGATVVEVNIQNHGRDGFSVQDNGSGIAPEDFANVAKRHATSKLSSFSELAAVRTLGFRGEALASLCALADVHITTNSGTGTGYELVFDSKGSVVSQVKVVRPKGTAVYVTDLFRTVPVRRRDFERNYQRELTKAIALLQEYALLSPVRLTVEHNVKNRRSTTLRSQGAKLLQRIACVYGASRTTKLMEINLTPEDLGIDCSVTGYISKPVFGMGVSTTDRQLIAVNGRPSKQAKLVRTIVDVYKQFNLTESPFFVLDFHMDPARYDVNVSPDKRALLLHHEAELVNGLRDALMVALNTSGHSVPRSNLELPSPKRQKQSKLSFATFAGSGAVIAQGTKGSEPSSDEEEAQSSEDEEGVPSSMNENSSPKAPRDETTVLETPSRQQPTVTENSGGGFRSTSLQNTEPDETLPRTHKSTHTANSLVTSELDSQSEFEPEEDSSNNNNDQGLGQEEAHNCGEAIDREEVDVSECEHEHQHQHQCEDQNRNQNRSRSRSQHIHNHKDNLDQESRPSSEQHYGRRSVADTEADSEADSEDEQDSPLVYPERTQETPCRVDRDRESSFQESEQCVDIKPELEEVPPVAPVSTGTLNVRTEPLRSVDLSQKVTEQRNVLADRMHRPAQPRSLNQHIHLPVSLADIRRAKKEVGDAPQDMKKLQKLAIDEEGAEERLSLNIRKQDFNEMEVVGQFNLGFILVVHRKKNHDDLFVIDQHASDEIYNFERLQKTTVLSRQPLVSPHPLELSAVEELTIAENLGVFENNGFTIQVSPANPPGKQCSLLSVPFSKNTVFDEKDVHDLLSKIQEDPENKHLRCSKLRAMLAMRACRSSIMIGKPLSLATMNQVVQNLGTLNKPWNCPHGRPTLRHITTLS